MVSIKKISAIATGALFVGATVGLAAAVSVPSDLSADMLADNGVAKAQLVVGKDAPGKDADTASAEIIKEAVAEKLAVSGAGGDIQIEYSVDDLNDDSTDDKEFDASFNSSGLQSDFADSTKIQLTSGNIGDGRYVNFTTPLLYDGNGDGDLKDSSTGDDYAIYNGVYVLDASGGEIQLGYEPVPDGTFFVGNMSVGDVVKIRGSKYVLTDTDLSDQNAEMGPAITKKLSPVSSVNPDSAVVISGTKKMLVYNNTLYLYDGNSLLDTITLNTTLTDFQDYTNNITSDEFKAYKLYAVLQRSAWYVTMAEKSQLVKVSNDQEGVLGYNKVKINDPDFPKTKEIILLGDPISLVKGDTVDIPDTYYTAKFTLDKYLDIKRKKTETVASGTKLKANVDPGKSFLNTTDIVMTVSGGSEATPELEIVDEDTASNDMNHVLIGGPVANKMVAQLVEAGKSKVDWYNSDGDIEVVSGHPAAGKYAIIVAGKDREATKAAAEALAAWL